MDDLISRQAAIDAIHEDADWLAAQGSDWQVERMDRDKSILMSLPSAESEIIRCKDCIWHNKNTNQCDRQVCAVMYVDDFCNYGKRRGEQNDTD